MKEARILRVLLAAIVLGTIVTPIAVAGAQGKPAPHRSSQKAVQKTLKGLKRQSAAIAGEIADLRGKIEALGAPSQEPQPPQTSPQGPAGGDLTGSYPNPKVRANAITSANVADGTLTSADIASNTIGSVNVADGAIGSVDIANQGIGHVDLGAGIIGAAQLVGVHVVRSGANDIGGNASGGISVSCGANERLLSGGAEWLDVNSGLFITDSRPVSTRPNEWEVIGRNSSGVTNSLFAYALCLNAG